MPLESSSHAPVTGSSSTRRLAWIACGLVAVLLGFVIGRGAETDLNAAPAEDAIVHPAPGSLTVPVVVELFTSQGCSSCPPADRLLAKLAAEQPVPGALIVPMSEHVDYWNRLGWTDPFSDGQFSDRQRTYAHAAGSRRIYTPQMMVDGRYGFVGSERKEALASIAKASMTPHAKVELTECEGEVEAWATCREVAVRNLPAVTDGDTARVVYAVTESGLAVDVPKGENAGRELSHVAVVRAMDVLGSVDADASDGLFEGRVKARIESDWQRENLSLVVFVQEQASRRILGAGVVGVADVGNRTLTP